jgi:hypothetical protein
MKVNLKSSFLAGLSGGIVTGLFWYFIDHCPVFNSVILGLIFFIGYFGMALVFWRRGGI